MERFSCGFEVKLAPDAADGMFSGYGAVFGNLDSYGDVIVKGAFRDTLRDVKKTGNWPAMLLQHGGFTTEDEMPVGIWTLMEEDDTGLRVEGKLAITTQRGRDAYELLKMQPRPALNGLSIGYRPKEFAYGTKPDEPRRTLKKVDLFECSLVTFPANDKARVGDVKSAGDIKTIRDFEAFLRESGGFSRAAATAIAAGGFKASPDPRDEDGHGDELVAAIRRAASILKS